MYDYNNGLRFADSEERRFWEFVYTAAVRAGRGDPDRMADYAVERLRERNR